MRHLRGLAGLLPRRTRWLEGAAVRRCEDAVFGLASRFVEWLALRSFLVATIAALSVGAAAAVAVFVGQSDIYAELAAGSASAHAFIYVILLCATAATVMAFGLLSCRWIQNISRDRIGEGVHPPRDLIAASGPRENHVPGAGGQDKREAVRSAVRTAALVVAAVAGVLWAGAVLAPPPESVGAELDQTTRVVTTCLLVLSIPSAATFAVIRWFSATGGEPETVSVERLRSGFELLQRQLLGFGVVLSLAVVTTAVRRDMIMTHTEDPEDLSALEDVPIEGVLLYGLGFAAVLAAFYAATASQLHRDSRTLIRSYAPIPAPHEDLLGWSKKNAAARELLEGPQGLTEQRRSLEAGLVVSAPLVTSLLNAAVT